MTRQGYYYDDLNEHFTYGATYAPSYDRIYVRPSVSLPGSDVDPVSGMLRPDTRRKGRTQALRMEEKRLTREYEAIKADVNARQEERGVRMSRRTAILLVAFFAFVFSITLLIQQGNLTERQKSLNKMNTGIRALQEANAALEAQIAEKTDQADICYAAAQQLGMVPAESAQAIHLTAVDTRPRNGKTYVTAEANP